MFIADEGVINRLQILQNKAMRILLNMDRYAKINVMLKKLEWLNVKNLILFLVLIFIFKVQNNLLPSHLKQLIVLNSDQHNYLTRNKNNFFLNNFSKNIAYKSVFHKGLIEFNKLNSSIKTQKSLKSFKKNLKFFLLAQQDK